MVSHCCNKSPIPENVLLGPNAWPPLWLPSIITHHAHSHLHTNLLLFPIFPKLEKIFFSSLDPASPVSLSPVSLLSFAINLLESFAHVLCPQFLSPTAYWHLHSDIKYNPHLRNPPGLLLPQPAPPGLFLTSGNGNSNLLMAQDGNLTGMSDCSHPPSKSTS